MRILLCILLVGLLPPSAHADERYLLDKAHTSILFSVNDFGVSRVTGSFDAYDGDFVFCLRHPDKNTIKVTLYSSGIHTTDGKEEEELRGPHFFNAAQYPSIRFQSTKVELKDDNDAEVTGALTLLGVTRPTVLHVHFLKKEFSLSEGTYAVNFTATGSIKRADFGMNYLNPLIGNEVQLRINATGLDEDEKEKR
jgi:polyisoprenoid-binding protein YceI